MNKKPAVALMAAFTLSPVMADEIDEIVVSATGIPTPLAQIGSSVDVITAEDLERQQITYLQDALKTVAGVSAYQQGGPGTKSNIFMRGTGGEYTAVFVDGIQINGAKDQSVSWANLPTHGLASVEVLRGPQSVLYGSEAIGGAVNMYTAVGGESAFTAVADSGSFGTQRLVGLARGETNHVAYGASIETLSTDGISAANEDNGNSEADGHEKTSVRLRLTADINAALSADIAYRMVSSEVNTDDYDYVQNRAADGASFAYNDKSDSTGLSLKLNYSQGELLHGVSYSNIEDEIDSLSAFGTTNETGKRHNLGYRGTLDFGDGMKLLVGADREVETFTAGTEYEAANLAAFAVMQLHVDGLATTIAARRDDHEEFGAFDTFRVSGLLDLDIFALRGTYGTAFRAPNLRQLYASGSGNSALLPEEGVGGDVGLIFGFSEDSKMEIAYFFSTITDLIGFGPAPNYQSIQTSGESKSSGLELRAQTILFGDYTLTGNYTYLNAEDADGERLVRRPRHSLNLAVSTEIADRISLNGNLQMVRDVMGLGNQALDDYSLLAVNGSYLIYEGVKATARIENLLDEDYETALGYGTPGRAFYVGVTSSF